MKNDVVSIIKRQIRNGFSWYGGDYVVCMIAKKIYQELNEQRHLTSQSSRPDEVAAKCIICGKGMSEFPHQHEIDSLFGG